MVSFLLPTRGRPNNVWRFIESVHATEPAFFDDFEFILRMDDDDTSMRGFSVPDAKRIKMVVGPRKEIRANLFDELTRYAACDHIWALGGDDMVARSPRWLSRVLRHFADGFLVVYGRDGIQDVKLPTWAFVHRAYKEVLGHIAPVDLFRSVYLDNWVGEVAGEAGVLKYDSGIFFEHLHPGVGTAPDDATYRERRVWDGVDQELFESTRHVRDAEIEKLLAWKRGQA